MTSVQDTPLTIAGKTFGSRLMVGTGKYRNSVEMNAAFEASGAEIITVALRRIDFDDPASRWLFRTPPLRNVAMTRPYMHDGALTTLRDVLVFYNQGGAGHPDQDPRIRPLGLSDSDLADLEAFLHSLTSSGLDCLAVEARIHPPDNY